MPASVATSADPRSKRPVKKRALTPVSAQAANVDALFAHPDQEIRVPTGGENGRRPRAPPEIVTNVQGSSAGAGSGEFHVYRAARLREYERVRIMEEHAARDRGKADFEVSKSERESRDDEKTRRNREKREKMRARKAKAKVAAERGPKATPDGDKQDKSPKALSKPAADNKPDTPVPEVAVNVPGIVIHDDED